MLKRFKSIVTGGKVGKNSKGGANDSSSASGFKEGVSKVSSLIKDGVENFIADLKVMREKSKDLLKTNVNLGIKHINNDNISDAIFRFKIISIFWPNYVKTYYYLAHCYILKNNYRKADISIRKLLEMDPSYASKVESMVSKINRNKSEQI